MQKQIDQQKHRAFTDYLGISGSLLCLAHCLLVPFLLIGKEVADHAENGHSLLDYFSHQHQPLLLSFSFNLDHLFLIIALGAAIHALRSSHRTDVKWMLVTGWLLFFIGVISFYPLVHLGSILLIVGHLTNLYFCRKHCPVVA